MSGDEDPKGAKDAATQLALKGYDGIIKPNEPEASEAVNLMLRAVLLPLRGLVWTMEQAGEYLNAKVGKRLEDKGVTEPRTPDPQLYISTVQGVCLAGSEDMRALYANLLATAMDPATAHLAHPSFAEVLRQLNPDEARLLPVLYERGSVEASVGNVKQPYRQIHARLPPIWLTRPDLKQVYVSNLLRLGLVEIIGSEAALVHKRLKKVERAVTSTPAIRVGHSAARALRTRPPPPPLSDHRSPSVQLVMTSYGVAFCQACMPEVTESKGAREVHRHRVS